MYQSQAFRPAHTLVAGLHGNDNATPGVHDTLSKRDNVVKHLVRSFGGSGNSGSLLQDLGHYGEVVLKVTANSASNIAEALQDSRLELVAKSVALKND